MSESLIGVSGVTCGASIVELVQALKSGLVHNKQIIRKVLESFGKFWKVLESFGKFSYK
jgi:flagellar biosynthesis/type III secretory pathway chaperone